MNAALQGKLWEDVPVEVRVLRLLRLSWTGASATDAAWLLGLKPVDVYSAIRTLSDEGFIEESHGRWHAIR